MKMSEIGFVAIHAIKSFAINAARIPQRVTVMHV
jgi:hypothetical protein